MPGTVRLLGLIISVGLADSLNPSTVGPALLIATQERGRRHLIHFTLAVFLVYFLGGALIALGPGQLLVSLLPHTRHRVTETIETVVGAALLAGAAAMWLGRVKLARKDLPGLPARGRSSALLGASITLLELPTAFPYFAALAALVGSGLRVPEVLVLLLIFNLCFVLPLLAMVVVLSVAGDRSQQALLRGREFIQRRWPHVLSVLLALAGLFVVLLGVSGLAGPGHGGLHRLARRLHDVLRP